MNKNMLTFINGTITYLKTFETSLRMAALKDDGQIDRDEQKTIEKANKLTEKYIRELEKLVD